MATVSPTPGFVGRARELAELTRSLDAAAAGRGALYLLAGEPGIGKSRLADVVTVAARERGFVTLWGRCWEDGGAPPYWPWVQVLRSYTRQRDIDGVGDGAAASVHHLSKLLPHLSADIPEAAVLDDTQSELGSFALFDAVAGLLHDAATRDPLLVVLDDLHACDRDSLRLLQFLARDLPNQAIVLVATYREAEADQGDTGPLLTELAREGQLVPLRGLGQPDVAACIEHILGAPPSAELARTVHDATLGNPFYVDSLVRLLAAEGRLEVGAGGSGAGLPIPPSVRETIQRRLELLDEPTRQSLRVAAVLGRSFTLTLLGVLVAEPVPALLDRLRKPLAWGIVVPDAELAGRYAFSHMLVRDTLYDELAAADRVRLHEGAAAALEQAHAGDLGDHLAEIAHHYLQAAAGEGVDRAVHWASRAGDHARAQHAYEEAATLYGRALDALEVATGDDPRRVELRLSLGAARTRAGDTEAGREVFLAAADLARRAGAADALAAAAVGYAGLTGFHFTGRVNPTLVALLEEALAALPEADSPARVRLLARLAVALYWTDDEIRRVDLSEQAVAMAERLGDPDTLAMAVHSRRYSQWNADNLDERLRDATRSLELALRAGNMELAASARRWRLTDLLELGDVAAVDRELDAHDQLARQLRQPFHQAHTTQFRALRAIMDGRYDAGEQLAREAFNQAERAGSRMALTFLGMQLFPALRQQARRDELTGTVRVAYEQAPPHPAAVSALALLCVEAGQHDRAAMLLDQLAREDLKDLRRDMMLLEVLTLIAPVCAALGDAVRGEQVQRLLAPFAGRTVVSGAPARACWGPVDHYLGILAALTGDAEQAATHFEAAAELSMRLGSPALLADARFEHGRMLLRLGGPAQRDTARRLLTLARRAADELGMVRLTEQIDALGEVPTDRAARPTPAAPSGPLRALRREGDYWAAVTADGIIRLQDRKGLRYLATLVDSPGREWHVLELVSAVEGPEPAPVTAPWELTEADRVIQGPGDAGELLDPQAKAAYRRRLDELDHLIEEATSFRDPDRLALLEAEREALVEQLSQAVGLGGRDRRAASAAERARVNVTRAIRGAIRHLADHDPGLGRDLDAAVTTGTFCAYHP